MQQASPAELHLVKLGVEVVLVEQEARIEKYLVTESNKKDEVRRITGMDDIDPLAAQNLHGQGELPEESNRVFPQVANRTGGLR